MAADEKITLLKGKVAKVEEEPGTADLQVAAEDVLSGKKRTRKFDLVVLAAGIVPQTEKLPGWLRARRVQVPECSRRQSGTLRRRLRAPAGGRFGQRAGRHWGGAESASVCGPKFSKWIRNSAFTFAVDAGSASRWTRRQLAAVATREFKAAVSRVHPFLCGGEGVGMIRQDVAAGAANALVIAACSRRVKTDAFAVDNRLRSRAREPSRAGHLVPQTQGRRHADACRGLLAHGDYESAEDRAARALVRGNLPKILVVGGGITGDYSSAGSG